MRRSCFIFFLILVAASDLYSQSLSTSGYFQNFALFRTDRDFDPSEPIYQPWGDTVGTLGTYAEPRFKLLIENVTLAFEPLLGFNVWSRNSPYAEREDEEKIMFLLRQLYSDVKISSAQIRVGYQYFADPIGIFVRHWLGGVSFNFGSLRSFIGQIPDQTFEGIKLSSNNFVNDAFIFALDFVEHRPDEDINVVPILRKGLFLGFYGVFDNSVVGKPLLISTMVGGYAYDTEGLNITGGVALQGGVGFRRAEKLRNEMMIAGAVELTLTKKGEVPFGGSVMLLSPDNSGYRDGLNSSFIYSGKSLSRTIFLTEDEIVVGTESIDLSVGEKTSVVFYNIRPGLLLVDSWVEVQILGSWSITPVLGAAFSLVEDNSSLSNGFAANVFGLELSPILSYRKDNISFDFANTLFLPSDASSTFVNLVNPYRRRSLIWGVELSLKIMF